MPDNPAVISRDAAASALCGGAMVGSYLIVAETIGTDGRTILTINKSDDLPPWKEMGMLRSAANFADMIDQTSWAAALQRPDDED